MRKYMRILIAGMGLVIMLSGGYMAIDKTKAQANAQTHPAQRTTVVKSNPTSEEVLRSFPHEEVMIGQASTQLPASKSYVTNIQIASNAINNQVVQPGETFSFNKVTGFPTADKGYQPGPGISNGQVVQMLGGGICQVSTTLYDSVLNANLEVVERYPHSLPVSYVPRGKDAMVYIEEGYDFQFKNTTTEPVIIKSSLQGGKLVVTLWEQKSHSSSAAL
ncbi:hypothetical protein DNHGIG_28430 [Collibacillus ludicampi]|uniref:VanW family protein n=1 Tax=Collibacillus ludicampi TaxID=2771369 RepID=A0AAV4LHK8_9BACL|nr:VanW family protein [Collibacillus ludicampi]GIM47294.1 hypothetical protein DNHGIG_28430 [Collibacillus ludicampi]